MGITKNRQSEETLRRMVEAAFPEKVPERMEELSDGYCNVTYRVIFADGERMILKVGPEDFRGNLRNEKGMMDVEMAAMELMQAHPEWKVPKVLFSDKSRSICTGEYFFMEHLRGQNFAKVSDSMTEEERAAILQEIGRAMRWMGGIYGKKYGILGQEEYDTQFDFVMNRFENMAKDIEGIEEIVKLPFTWQEMLQKLKRDKPYFDDVPPPSLLHWDMWDGNVFVEDGRISGLIDWERTMFAEPIMSDRFRRHTLNDDLLEGFGQKEFSQNEKRRMAWYDVFLFTTMTVEEIYRQYEDDSSSRWVRPFLDSAWNEIG